MTTTYSDSAMTDLATVRSWLGLKAGETQEDTLITNLIARASQALCQLTNRTPLFDSGTDIAEARHGNGKDRIYPKVAPIVSVTSVAVDGVAIPVATTTTASGFLFDERAIYLRGHRFTLGIQNVTLVYRGGIAQSGNAQQCFEQACISIVASWYKRRSHIDQTSENLNGQITKAFTLADIPSDARMLVAQFTRYGVTLE
jgi:hypothetical protein